MRYNQWNSQNMKNDLDNVLKSEMTNDEVISHVFKNYLTLTLADAKKLVENERPNVKHIIGYQANYRKYLN